MREQAIVQQRLVQPVKIVVMTAPSALKVSVTEFDVIKVRAWFPLSPSPSSLSWIQRSQGQGWPGWGGCTGWAKVLWQQGAGMLTLAYLDLHRRDL